MTLYRLSFHGPEETKNVMLKGPELSIPIQSLFEAFMESAAGRCYEKFNSHNIEILPEDIFDEVVEMLTERGFRHAKEHVAVVAGTQVGHGDFGDKLGKNLNTILSYNDDCRKTLNQVLLDPVL